MGLLSLLFGKSLYKREGRLDLKDRDEVRLGWERVEEQARIGKPSNNRQAVIEADKVLDFVLKRMYPNLETTGERLKSVKSRFQGSYEVYDGLWFAHKVRNELVHNMNFELPSSQVGDVLEKFKAGLTLLGAL